MQNIGNKAQLGIWIIIAVVLVAVIILFYLINERNLPEIIKPGESESVFDAESFLSSCIKESVDEVTEIMIPQGGFREPRNYFLFNNTKVEYLCENIGLYSPCINQHPLLIDEIEGEIKKYIEPKLIECLDEMKREFESRRSRVVFNDDASPEININLAEDKIIINVKKKISVTKQGETRSFENLNVEIKSPIYNLANIAREIASQEAQYCYFEYVGYSLSYPRYEIRKFGTSEPTKIYTIKDLKSGKEMNIAIRSCAIPAGLSGR
ncbi:hypothetical protein HYV50_05400 [Candidatus Pacearchaeota archaeon]|nr:hypothetical protein [Candidatus Pacearchaeota archaeon]